MASPFSDNYFLPLVCTYLYVRACVLLFTVYSASFIFHRVKWAVKGKQRLENHIYILSVKNL